MTGFEIITPHRASAQFAGLCALGVMTKVPQPRKVKTRLSPPLTPGEAAELNACFLRDLSRSITSACAIAPAKGVAVYTPVGKEAAYNDILSAGFLLLPQRGDAFDQRLGFAVTDLFDAGFAAACLINSDSPTVPAEHFAEAANELAKPGDRIVLGPSDDGGYYLIGLKTHQGRVFEAIDWSTERVLEQTLERVREISVPVHQLPSGYDVDDWSSLRRLCEDLLGPGGDSTTAPHTQRWLRAIVDTEGRDRIWPDSV